MKCPIDNIDLVMADRQGIEIDYCPQCRGVWLDRGELDKIIERSQQFAGGPAQYTPVAPSPPQYSQVVEPQGGYVRLDNDARDYRGGEYNPKKRKRESFLSELFDFD